MTTLYRADRVDLHELPGMTSWTTSGAYANEYADGRYYSFGGRCIYRTEVGSGVRVLDLRIEPSRMLDQVGVDLNHYEDKPQDLYRALADIFCAHGWVWVAFREQHDLSFDEWLYLGEEPIPAG